MTQHWTRELDPQNFHRREIALYFCVVGWSPALQWTRRARCNAGCLPCRRRWASCGWLNYSPLVTALDPLRIVWRERYAVGQVVGVCVVLWRLGVCNNRLYFAGIIKPNTAKWRPGVGVAERPRWWHLKWQKRTVVRGSSLWKAFVNFCIYYRQTDINVLIQPIYKKIFHFTEFLMDKTQ